MYPSLMFPPNQKQYKYIHPQLPNNTEITRMFSTCEEEIENVNEENSSQIVKSIKKKISNENKVTSKDEFTISIYSLLTQTEAATSTSNGKTNDNFLKLPPILVYRVLNFAGIVKKIFWTTIII